MKKHASVIGFVLAFLVLSPALLHGQCTVSAVGVNFGSYEPLASIAATSTGTIAVYCTLKSSVTISIGPSPNSGGFNPRKMINTSRNDFLKYNLYTTSAMTAIWGNGTGGTSTVSKQVARRVTSNSIVYGRAPAGQDVYIGQYGESLVVTINF